MEEQQAVHLYLDQDDEGRKNTFRALEWDKKYLDQSNAYPTYKDLNDFLMDQKHELKQSHRLGIR
jgi:hypothetical protein